MQIPVLSSPLPHHRQQPEPHFGRFDPSNPIHRVEDNSDDEDRFVGQIVDEADENTSDEEADVANPQPLPEVAPQQYRDQVIASIENPFMRMLLDNPLGRTLIRNSPDEVEEDLLPGCTIL